MTDVVTQGINGFAPNIQVPYADSFSGGYHPFAREEHGPRDPLCRHAAATPGSNLNYNEFNIVENGFLKEFRHAQANLQANIAAGRGNTFAYVGAGSGTEPAADLPGALQRPAGGNAGKTALYTGANWTNATFLGFLAAQNPNPFGFASTNANNGLVGTATFRNERAHRGPAAELLRRQPGPARRRERPNIDETRVLTRCRLSSAGASHRACSSRPATCSGTPTTNDFRRSGSRCATCAGTRRRPATSRTSSRGTWCTTCRSAAAAASAATSTASWTASSAAGRSASPRRCRAAVSSNLGNVRLVGMSASDVSKMFKLLRFDDAGKQVYMLPQDVIDNTILAFTVSATTASGYAGTSPTGRYFAPANGPDCIEIAGGFGDCGTGTLVVTGPLFQQHDIRFSKRTTIVGHVNFEFAAEMLNAFNHPNFLPVSGIGSTTLPGYQLTGLQGPERLARHPDRHEVNW